MAEEDTHKHDSHEHNDLHEHEAHEHHHEAHEHHAEHAHHASAAKPASNLVMWGGFVIVLLVVAGVSYTLGAQHAAQSNGSGQQTSTPQSVLNSSSKYQSPTTVPAQPAPSPPTPINVSSVKYFITPAEAASIIGPGGNSAVASTTAPQLNSSFNQDYGVTGEYQAQFNNNATNTIIKSNLVEFIIVSTKSNSVYKLDLNSTVTSFTAAFLKSIHATNSTQAVNQTADGMTYSFFSFTAPLPPMNHSATQTTVFGFKNNTFVSVQLFSSNTSSMANATHLASLAASHLN